MAMSSRTRRLFQAIDNGAVRPPAIAREVGLPTATVRGALYRLRRRGQFDRDATGAWRILPHPDSASALEVLQLLERDSRRWTIAELATCLDRTTGQVLVILDVLARNGLVERVNKQTFRSIDPDALTRL